MIIQKSKVFKTGHSQGIILPKKLVTSKTITLAVGRILIADPEGMIPPEKLSTYVRLVEREIYKDE